MNFAADIKQMLCWTKIHSLHRPILSRAVSIVFCLIANASIGQAQQSGEQLTRKFANRNYDEIRNFLIGDGWAPRKGGDNALYSEISCGTRGDCVGFWSKSRGREYFILIDDLRKPFTVKTVEFQQTVSQQNQGQLIGSYCLGNFSNVSASRISGDFSGLEINVKSDEIEVVVAEGDLIGTTVKEFTVTGSQLRFRYWDNEFVGNCSGQAIKQVSNKNGPQTLNRRTVLLANRSSIKWEDNAASIAATDRAEPASKAQPELPAPRTSSSVGISGLTPNSLSCRTRPNINFYSSPIRRQGTFIECTVKENRVDATAVQVNRGNCPAVMYARTLKFGDVLRIEAFCDAVIELDLELNGAVYRFEFPV